MGTITVFRNIFSSEKEEYTFFEGQRVNDIVNFEEERSHVIVNGLKKDADYMLCDGDVCVIYEYPGLSVGGFVAFWIFTIVFLTVEYYVEGFTGKGILERSAEWLTNYMYGKNDSDRHDQNQISKIPQLRGAKNQSWASKPVPLVLGEHLFTPGYCSLPYTQIDPATDPDGEKQFITMAFMLGYAPIIPTDIRMGEILIATNNAKTINGFIAIDGAYSGSVYGMQIEVRDSAELSLYPQKVVEDSFNIELLNVEGIGPGYPIRFSAVNTMKLQVEIFFNGLFSLNDKGERRPATVEVRAQWRPLNGSDSQWVDLPGFINATSFSGGVNTFTRTEAKQMRFISTKVFTYAEMSTIPTGIVEVRLFRNNVKSTNMRVNDSVYWTAIRSWCFDKERSIEVGSFVPQIPVEQKLREKTVRLAFKVYAKDDLSGVLNSINMILKSITRTWNGSAWSTKSAAYSGKTTSRNPAAVALTVLQGKNLGKNAYTDSELDMAEFGRFYDFCQTKGFTCNGVITNDQSLDAILSGILFTGRAQKIIKDGLYSLYVDKPQANPVTILNNQNVISASNTKDFDRIPDGLRITFVDEYDRYQMNEMYVMADGKSSSDPDAEFLDVDLTYITDRNHVWKIGRYILACLILRPEVWTRKVSIDGIGMHIGSLISVQDDTIVVGLNSGGEVKNLIMSGSSIVGIESDSYFDMVDGTLYGVKILQTDGVNDPTIRTIHVQTEPGTQNKLYFVNPISAAETIRPSIGDIIAFGQRELITVDAIVVGSVPADNGQYELTLIPYDPAIYQADQGSIPPFNSKITIPQQVVIPKQIPTVPVTLAEVGELIDPIVDGSTDFIPDDLTAVTAIARQDYIDISWAWDGSSLKNSIKRFIVEVSKDAGASWIVMHAAGNRIPYYFNRTTDGHPEKTTGAVRLDAWRVRVKAENIYGNASQGYGPSSAGQELDLSEYLTWIPKAPYGITAKAEETGILVSWKADESDYYGSNKTYSIGINGTIEMSGVQGRSVLVPFNRSTHGYPEKLSSGGTLDIYQINVSAHTVERTLGTAAPAVTPDVSGYLTWIPAVPSISGKASGRSVSLEFTLGNQCYGFKSFDIQIQRSGAGSWYAIGDSALAWTDEESYRSGSVNDSTPTPFNQLAQTVPLSGQAGDLPVDTDYLYRVRMSIQKGASVVSSSYSSAITVKARATATKDIVSGAVKNAQLAAEAVTYDKIAARTVQAENLHALATNLVNTLVSEPNRTLVGSDFPQGWNKGTVGGAGSISTTSRGQSLYLTVTAAGQGISSYVFNVAPDEILEVTFLIYRSTAGNGAVTLRADASGAPTTGIARWVWDDSLKTWVSASAIYTLIDAAVTSAAWRSFKTYILGCDVDIADVPSPAPGSLGNTISCVRVASSRNTAQLVFLFGEESGTIIIAAPCVASMSGGKVIASQITVKNLSAISSKLGEINGDTADYKLVMGSGGSAEEGTFLLGSTSDASYFRRWKEGNVWRLAMKLATFFVDAVTSKILGTFQVRNTSDNNTTFEVRPADNCVVIDRGMKLCYTAETNATPGIQWLRVCKIGNVSASSRKFSVRITGKPGWNDRNAPGEIYIVGSLNHLASGTIGVGGIAHHLWGNSNSNLDENNRVNDVFTSAATDVYFIRQSGYAAHEVDIYIRTPSNQWLSYFIEISADVGAFSVTKFGDFAITDPTIGATAFNIIPWRNIIETDRNNLTVFPGDISPNANVSRVMGSSSLVWARGFFQRITSNQGNLISSFDSWLRLNEGDGHTSGVYAGSRPLRTDGVFQVGPGGERFQVSEDGSVRVGPAGQEKLRISADNSFSIGGGQLVSSAEGSVFTSPKITLNSLSWRGANQVGTSSLYRIVENQSGILIAVGVNQNIQRSTDGGGSWSPVALPKSGTFYDALAIGSVFLVVGRFFGSPAEAALCRSIDGGNTWSQNVNTTFGSTAIKCIAIGNGVVVIVGDGGKVARSTDGGLSWSSVTASVFGGIDISSLLFTNGVFIAGTSSGIIARSTNNGTSWVAATVGGGPYNSSSIVYGISNADGVLIAVGNTTLILRSIDNGVSWSKINPASGVFDSLIFVCTYFNGILFAGGGGGGKIGYSYDKGLTWLPLLNIHFVSDAILGLCVIKNRLYVVGNQGKINYLQADQLGAGIIESGTSTDGLTKYVLFSDGTLQCWGNNIGVSGSFCLITFPYAFADSTYGVGATAAGGSTGVNLGVGARPNIPEGYRTNTSMRVYINNGSTQHAERFTWTAIGRAAI